MPGQSGIEATPRVLQEAPDAKVLVLSMQDDPRYVREAFAAGASGYVLKEAADTEVVAAVREVAERRPLRPPRARRAARRGGGRGARRRARTTRCPSASARCCGSSPSGHTNQEIAKMLYISVRTAETHRAHIMQKLRLQTRAELVRYALAHGLLEEDEAQPQ